MAELRMVGTTFSDKGTVEIFEVKIILETAKDKGLQSSTRLFGRFLSLLILGQ